jgi:hypothetical protein
VITISKSALDHHHQDDAQVAHQHVPERPARLERPFSSPQRGLTSPFVDLLAHSARRHLLGSGHLLDRLIGPEQRGERGPDDPV